MPTPSDYRLKAEYPKQQVVKDRNYVGLNQWAVYTASLPVPAEQPDATWVKIRIVAERIPQQLESYVQRTLSYFAQDEATQTNIRQYLSAFNDEATETALASQIEAVIGSFMPRFVGYEITDEMVNQWYINNGYDVMPLNAMPRAGSRPNPMNQPM